MGTKIEPNSIDTLSVSNLNNVYALSSTYILSTDPSVIHNGSLTDTLNTLYEVIAKVNIGSIIFGTPDKYLSNLLIFPFNYLTHSTGSIGDLYIANNQIKHNVESGNVTTTFTCKGRAVSDRNLFYLGTILYPYYNSPFYYRSGYTKIRCWLPYLGFIELSPNDFIGDNNKYMNFILSVDPRTGQATYYVCSSKERMYSQDVVVIDSVTTVTSRIVSQHTFKLGITIPLGSTNANDVARNIIMGTVKAGIGVASTAIGMGIGAGTATANSVSTITKATTQKVRPMARVEGQYKPVGRQMVKGSTSETSSKQTTTTYDSSGHLKGKMVNECFEGLGNAISSLHYSGTCDRPNDSALLLDAPREVYIQILTPKMKSDTNYAELYGKPLGEVRRIGDMHGYTEIAKVHIQGDAFKKATREEIGMLSDALSDGIILPRTTPTT